MFEYGRDADDFWDERHFKMVAECIKEFDAKLKVSPVLMGERITL